MSGFNCCFLTCIQVSQKADEMVWYSHLFKNFPWFALIYTVKGFSIVSEAEVDVFLQFSCFFCDPAVLAIWSLVPLPFLNPAWTFQNSQFRYYWSLAWRILSITFASMWNECNCALVCMIELSYFVKEKWRDSTALQKVLDQREVASCLCTVYMDCNIFLHDCYKKLSLNF